VFRSTDAIGNRNSQTQIHYCFDIPEYGCLKDKRIVSIPKAETKRVWNNIWSIGGKRGWYFGNWMWRIRGVMDKIFGGVGLRRGRRSPNDLKAGDALDFWRVILADQDSMRLLLFAEMKLPGEAWLEFRIKLQDDSACLIQTATFRPLGLWGRLYWYILVPFHGLIFPKMANRIVSFGVNPSENESISTEEKAISANHTS
jgi:hypothetical protein